MQKDKSGHKESEPVGVLTHWEAWSEELGRTQKSKQIKGTHNLSSAEWGQS
jgi:hypothetical protein